MDQNNYGEGPFFGFEDRIGETVTIFTTSGGLSGAGFTGVLLSANPIFVRLITRIGPPPSCALGNSCTGFFRGSDRFGFGGGFGGFGLGSIVDIPVNRIASVVFNTV